MNNLASLASNGLAPAFNNDYYATAATTIPVLFLAVIVQGGAYVDLLNAVQPMMARAFRLGRSIQGARMALAAGLVLLAAALVVMSAACGELWAIVALYWHRSISGSAPISLTALIILIVTVVIRPFAYIYVSGYQAVLRAWTDFVSEAEKGNSAQKGPELSHQVFY